MLITASATLSSHSKCSSEDSLSQLWRICFPLMLSALSGTLMLFFARIILARYDTNAMIAATAASNIALVFQLGAISIAMIAEVFVGQFNGASQWQKIGRPVWQMIWFALACGLIMLPVGLWGARCLLPAEFMQEGASYFRWIMIFGPSFPLVSALSAFFIGRGKVKIVTFSVIIGNLINLILVLLLVFGIPGLINPMGAKGAAIATGVAESCIAFGLFALFLNAHHRKKYHTHLWQFDKDLFIKCIKIGLPNAVGHTIGIAAWATLITLLADKGIEYVTAISIALTIWSLFSFITEGLQKGITALASNHIGAKNNQGVKIILMRGLQLQLLLALLLAIPLLITPKILIQFFIPSDSANMETFFSSPELLISICHWLWVAYLFDGMAWVIDGILTAAGDTKFIMLMNSIGTWILCIAPIYFLIVKGQGSPILLLQIITVFCFILFISYFLRYKSKKWKKIAI